LTISNFNREYLAIPNFAQETDNGTLLSAFDSIMWQCPLCLVQCHRQTHRQTLASVYRLAALWRGEKTGLSC